MKKVGIISCFWSDNYGAVLQAVALAYKIRELGFQPLYVNYIQSPNIKGRKLLFNKAYFFLQFILGYRKRNIRTEEFRKQYLPLTNKVKKYEELENIVIDLDFFILGSDQMWNPRTLGVKNGYYLLEFVKLKPKISYATSFGVSSLPTSLILRYKKALESFLSLSVRERTGQVILSGLNLKSDVVLDPTLLLTKTEWASFFSPKSFIQSDYILCYVMSGDHKSANFIWKYAKLINMRCFQGKKSIVILGDKEYKRFKPLYNLICNAGPSEFLNLISNSCYVVTNSFHGTCFSINFEKKFTTILDRENVLNSRIIDLLTDLSLLDTIKYTDMKEEDYSLAKIDYVAVDNRLKFLRKNSLEYLKNKMKI